MRRRRGRGGIIYHLKREKDFGFKRNPKSFFLLLFYRFMVCGAGEKSMEREIDGGGKMA